MIFIGFWCLCLLFTCKVRLCEQNVGGDFFNQYFRYILETQLRREMATGLPSFGLPPLDPLYLRFIPIYWGDKSSHLDGNIKEMSIKGFSTFNLTDFQANIVKRNVTFSMYFRKLLTRGQYSLKGKLWSVFNVKGKGQFVIVLSQVLLQAKAVVYFDKIIEIRHLELNSNFRHIEATFENLLGKGRLNSLFNLFLTRFGPFTYNIFKPLLMEKAGNVLKQHINAKMKKIKMSDFLLTLM